MELASWLLFFYRPCVVLAAEMMMCERSIAEVVFARQKGPFNRLNSAHIKGIVVCIDVSSAEILFSYSISMVKS
jgi:hypothetical protein